MKELILGKGEICLVDDEDYARLSKFRWNKSQYGYAYRLGDRNKGEKWKVLMHREIMGAQDGQIIDHKNGNRIDNRKENLRFATPLQNATNRNGKIAKSGYKGVFRNTSSKRESWIARIKVNKKLIHIGCYPTMEQAARAYNQAALKYHGDFARLNAI
ncbi:AP2 domain-containing protein [Paenibacillus naphthalenovorans]|uniref:AP2 domain-containing protein n=1 Tax=Paenibacillus naphthalenovorans TaxID=162209 RepID=UPI0008870106|nr:AP2 domain-containing protein [Paenibacillus naphthalenovorans]SDJ61839.1 HNH endonuclease [Paenibacillus naphthalenovorans]